jgi:hypothetical protein
MNKIKHWWLTLIREEYELTVWFVNATGGKTAKVFNLKDVKKKTQNHITGTDMNGKFFEIKTVEPFDYQLRKIY